MEEEGVSWGLRNMLTFGKSPADTERGVSEKSVDRYQHDMQQAKLMRRAMRKKQEDQHDNQWSEKLTEEDVLLGLQGLDKADDLRKMGDFEQSLKMSEMSMELLIQFLRSNPVLLPEVSRETISQRVQCALTDAEEMKRKVVILKNSSPKNAATSPSSQTSSKGAASNETSQALSRALAGAVRKVKISGGLQAAGQSTPSPQKTTSPQHAVAREAPAIASNFYNSQDPLVQAVKSELYIDQSQLQETSWEDIAGLEIAKQSLQENAILPMVRPDLFTGLRRPRNILLYGPPGTGKTLLVKAVAKESQCLLFICTASSLTSKWHGEGEKLLRTLFQVARAAAPSIIFVDEMDALLSSRKSDGEHEASRRFKTEFMTQVDGIVQGGGGTNSDGKHLLLIACTNCPWDIDAAVMRRFSRRIYIPLPDSKARKVLLKKLLHEAGKHQLSSADTKTVVKRLSGFSGSDISAVASEASFGPIRSIGGIDAIRLAAASQIRPISYQDFDTAITQATKSVGKKQIQQYEQWKQEQAAT